MFPSPCGCSQAIHAWSAIIRFNGLLINNNNNNNNCNNNNVMKFGILQNKNNFETINTSIQSLSTLNFSNNGC